MTPPTPVARVSLRCGSCRTRLRLYTVDGRGPTVLEIPEDAAPDTVVEIRRCAKCDMPEIGGIRIGKRVPPLLALAARVTYRDMAPAIQKSLRRGGRTSTFELANRTAAE